MYYYAKVLSLIRKKLMFSPTKISSIGFRINIYSANLICMGVNVIYDFYNFFTKSFPSIFVILH